MIFFPKFLLCVIFVSYSAFCSEVTLAIASDYTPIHFGQDNPNESISKEILTEIFKNQDQFQLRFTGFPWERAQQLVKEGTQDAFISVPTPDRMKYAVASQSPVLIQKFQIFFSKSSNNLDLLKKIKTLNDLENLKICEYFSSGWAKQNLASYLKNIIYSRTIETKLKMLNSGRCDLIIDGDIVVNYYMKKLDLKNIIPLDIEVEKTKFHLMLSKKSKHIDFLEYFNQNNLFEKNPLKYQEIVDKWTM